MPLNIRNIKNAIEIHAILNDVYIEKYGIENLTSSSFVSLVAIHLRKQYFRSKHIIRDKVLFWLIKKKIVFVGDGSDYSITILERILNKNLYDIVGYVTTSTIPKKCPIRVFGTYDILQTVYDKGIMTAYICTHNKNNLEKADFYARKLGFTILDSSLV